MTDGLCNKPLPSALATATWPARKRLQQTRHAQDRIVAQFQRIAKIVIDPAQNDVDLFQAAQGFQIDAIVAHRQVLSFDQHIAQIARQVTLLKIRLVAGAGGEKNDATRCLSICLFVWIAWLQLFNFA